MQLAQRSWRPAARLACTCWYAALCSTYKFDN